MLLVIFILIGVTTSDIKSPLFSITIDVQQKSIIRSASLQSLMQINQIEKVHLLMGHLTNRLSPNIFPSNNIAHIYSKAALSQAAIHQIASIFGVSRSSAFVLQQPELNLTTISDPNDRFCTENFEILVRQFLPCKNWVQVGLQQFHGFDKLFKGFLGMEFVWQINKIRFKIVGQRQKKTILGSFEKTTVCGLIKQKQYEIKQDQEQLIISKRVSLSKWYYPEKTIVLTLRQLNRTLLHNASLSLINRIPAGFRIKNIEVSPKHQRLEVKITQSKGDYLVFMSSQLPLIEDQMLIRISFTAGFPLIERFQSIAGGGQEIMGLTRILREDKIIQLPTPRVTESLLQPDFSIAFKSITGGIAIILIMWLTLWRNHELISSPSVFDKQQ